MKHPLTASSRRPKLPVAVVVAASLILLIILMLALAAHAADSTSPSVTSVMQDYEQVAPRSQQNRTNLLDREAQPLAEPQQPLSPKLQPNVLSTFSTVAMPAIEPTSPEQSAFVQGYKQLKPVLSTTSYIPLSHHPTQGIILPAGKSLRLGSAYVTLQLLRNHLQCQLPVEIWHVAGEIDDHSKAVFEVSMTLHV